ncbi:hypothetical protein ACWEVD_01880 [Nocardia thailandica]
MRQLTLAIEGSRLNRLTAGQPQLRCQLVLAGVHLRELFAQRRVRPDPVLLDALDVLGRGSDLPGERLEQLVDAVVPQIRFHVLPIPASQPAAVGFALLFGGVRLWERLGGACRYPLAV